jgi:hypothetical protein
MSAEGRSDNTAESLLQADIEGSHPKVDGGGGLAYRFR